MRSIDILKTDLNLLAALSVLLEEQSVTKAARRMGRTQPAMSHTLGRLRDLLGDPLLLREGRGMVRTARADALQEPLARALAELGRVLHEEGDFDPLTSTRTFRLGCPDLLAGFLPQLLSAIQSAAPQVVLEVRTPRGGVARTLESVDIVLGAAFDTTNVEDLMRSVLGQSRFMVLARCDHPGVGKRLTSKRWTDYPHIQVGDGDGKPGAIDRALLAQGIERRVGLRVPNFLTAIEVVAETDHFLTVPEALVRAQAARLNLQTLTPPATLPKVAIASYWRERFNADAAHSWLREVVKTQVMRALASHGEGRRRRGV